MFPFLCVLSLMAAMASSPKIPAFDEEVVVTASSEEESVADVPAEVAVLEVDEQRPWLSQLLFRSSSVMSLSPWSPAGATSVFVRGAESDQHLVLFAGIRLNSPYFAGFDWSLLSGTGVDRVEVLKGPFSPELGTDAVGGVISLIPQSPPKEFSVESLAEAGENGWLRGGVSFGGPFSDNAGFMLSASRLTGSEADPNSGFAHSQAVGNFRLGLGNMGDISVVLGDISSDVEIPRSLGVASPRRHQSTDLSVLAVPGHVSLGAWTVKWVVGGVRGTLRFRDPDDPWGFVWSRTETESQQARFSAAYKARGFEALFGGEWMRGVATDIAPWGANLLHKSQLSKAVFASLSYKSDRVHAVFSAREESTDEWGGEFLPSVRMGFRVGRGALLYSSWGRAFRAPSVGELYFPSSGNPDLEPECALSYEAGFKLTRAKWRASVAAFRTTMTNMIDFDYASWRFNNVGWARVTGVEAEFAASVEDLLFGGAVSALSTEDGQGRDLLRRPRWSAGVWCDAEISNGLRLGGELRYVGVREDIDPATFERRRVSGWLLASVSGEVQLSRAFSGWVRVENVLDRSYEAILGFPAPGMRAYAGLRWGWMSTEGGPRRRSNRR